MTDDMREKTITEVMRNPIVSYRVSGSFEGGREEQSEHFDEEVEALDAARMMEAAGATNITVERLTVRVVEEREEVDWATSNEQEDAASNAIACTRCGREPLDEGEFQFEWLLVYPAAIPLTIVRSAARAARPRHSRSR